MSAIIMIPVNPSQSKGSSRVCKEKSTDLYLLLGPVLVNDEEWNRFIFNNCAQSWQSLGKSISLIYPIRKVPEVEQLVKARVRCRICVFCMLDTHGHTQESWAWSPSTTACRCASVLLLQFEWLGHHQQQRQMWLAITMELLISGSRFPEVTGVRL